MRLLLAITLILLFLWLYTAQMSSDALDGYPCVAVSTSKAAVSLLLSPLSLYSWMSSTLLRLILATPALLLSSLHHSFLLLLAWPWCVASVCASVLFTCLKVAVYLLHLALGFGAVAILILARHKIADGDCAKKKMMYGHSDTRLMVLGRKVVQQG